MCRKVWQFKASAALHDYTGRSERTCRAWSAGDNDASATALAQLLRSDEGGSVLDYIMQDRAPSWWRELQRARRIAEALRDNP